MEAERLATCHLAQKVYSQQTREEYESDSHLPSSRDAEFRQLMERDEQNVKISDDAYVGASGNQWDSNAVASIDERRRNPVPMLAWEWCTCNDVEDDENDAESDHHRHASPYHVSHMGDGTEQSKIEHKERNLDRGASYANEHRIGQGTLNSRLKRTVIEACGMDSYLPSDIRYSARLVRPINVSLVFRLPVPRELCLPV